MKNKELLLNIASEAHIMGRIYNKLGEEETPAEVWKSLERMVERMIAEYKSNNPKKNDQYDIDFLSTSLEA
jgi:hypothetical protein